MAVSTQDSNDEVCNVTFPSYNINIVDLFTFSTFSKCFSELCNTRKRKTLCKALLMCLTISLIGKPLGLVLFQNK